MKTVIKLEEQNINFNIRIKNLENELIVVKDKLNEAQKVLKSISENREKTKCCLISNKTGLKSKDKIKLDCKVCKQSFKNTDDLNEHYQRELYCKTCEECIIGYYESNSENCIPDVEEHITHEWEKIKNK